MIYNNIEKIKFPFLHNAIKKLSKKYSFHDIYMDEKGEMAIEFYGKLSIDSIKDILVTIHPKIINKDDIELDYSMNYSFSDDMKETRIYSASNIDYRTF